MNLNILLNQYLNTASLVNPFSMKIFLIISTSLFFAKLSYSEVPRSYVGALPKCIGLTDSTTANAMALDAYSQGKSDAKKYHRRGLGNAALGLSLCPAGIIGTALGNLKEPNPVRLQDTSLLTNPDYRRGYRRVAKRKNILNAALGSSFWGVVLLVGYDNIGGSKGTQL